MPDIEWKWVRLGDIAELIMGQSPPANTYNKEGEGVPFYQGKKEFGNIFLKEPNVWCAAPKKFAEPNDILFSLRAPVGNVNITKIRCCIGRGLAVVRAQRNTYVFYLFYYLRSKESDWRGKGAVFGSTSKINLLNFKIPIPYRDGQPDLEEQRRIADTLDRIFSKIDAAIENVKRQIEDVNNLFRSILTRTFSIQENDEWKWVRLGEYVKMQNGYSFKSVDFSKQGISVIRISDIKNGKVTTDNAMKINVEVKEYERFIIKKGDLLIAMSGATTGKIGEYIEDKPALLNQRVGLFKIIEKLEKSYLKYILQIISSSILEKAWGMAQPNISSKEIESFKIPIPYKDGQPDIEKQEEIAKYLEQVYKGTKQLSEKYEEQLKDLGNLKESFLKTAFDGKL